MFGILLGSPCFEEDWGGEKKERRKERKKRSGFFNNSIGARVCFSVSLVRIRRLQFFSGPKQNLSLVSLLLSRLLIFCKDYINFYLIHMTYKYGAQKKPLHKCLQWWRLWRSSCATVSLWELKGDAMISDALYAACSLGQYPPSVIIKEQQRKLTQKHECWDLIRIKRSKEVQS